VPCPIIREKNGLAMSSRNEYLSTKSRESSSVIFAGLQYGISLLNNGERNSNKIKKGITQFLLTEPLAKIDYISISDNISLKEIKGKIAGDILISSAIYFDKIRLIDNITYSTN
jgi:pantoate--beta-alanine ligase